MPTLSETPSTTDLSSQPSTSAHELQSTSSSTAFASLTTAAALTRSMSNPNLASSASLPQPDKNWKTVSNKNKRKGSPIKKTSTGKQSKITNYWLGPSTPTLTSNQYESLEEDEATVQAPSEPRPPPIFVNDVENIAPLQKLLLLVAPEGYAMKIINTTNVKIMAKSKEFYSAIINALSEKSTKFHTYQLKENRAFRVVLRNVHPTTSTEEIKAELMTIGHIVRNIHVVIQRGTKKPLSMFYVDLEPNTNNKDIYKVELFMHLRVKFEPPRQKREIVQCTKCQRFGHTKHFCHNNARCVKCVGNHSTESCSRKQADLQV